MIPIVLHHGLFGFDVLSLGSYRLSYFHRIDRAIAARGYPLIVSRVHPTCGVVRRARQLQENVLRQLHLMGRERDRVLILAHSMGGLDARYMISRLGMARHVAALVTICTPHRGSAYADWCVRHLGRRLGGFQLLNLIGLDMQGAVDVTTGMCRRFNEEVIDDPGVRYFSISAARPWHQMPPFAWHSHKIIQDAEGDNDGLVSVASARWGEHLETWPADHWLTINRRLPRLNNPTGDITPFYMRLLDRLEEAGMTG